MTGLLIVGALAGLAAGWLIGGRITRWRRERAKRQGPRFPAGEYERSTHSTGEWVEHLHGVDWFYADVPPRRHRCWPQTRAWLSGELVERCACGSLRFDGYGPWIDRNSRKPLTPQERAGLHRERERDRALTALISAYEDAEQAGDWDRCDEIRKRLRDEEEQVP